MNILICNVGSTSLKYQLFDMDNLYAAFSSGKKGCEPYRDILGGNYLRPAKLTALVLNVMANSSDPEKYGKYAEECINHSDIRVQTAAHRLLGKELVADGCGYLGW